MADYNKHPVLIVGGGVSGVVCALELDRLGTPVALLEKEDSPGGLAARFCCKATEACNKCFACVADKKFREIGDRPGISLITGAEITAAAGGPGKYRVAFTRSGETSELEASAIVVAAGIDPFDAAQKGEYGYGVCRNVITARDLEEMLRCRGGLSRPSDGALPRTIAFFQCVGSRDESIGNRYCSQVCCAYALRLIRTIRHKYPDCRATFYYMDIQPAGESFGAFLNACRKDPGVRFVRSIPSKIYHSPATDALRVRVAEPGRGEVVEEPYDMVVLSVGMVLKKEAGALGKLLGIGLTEEGFLAAPPPDKGLFVAGACGGPKDIVRSVTQARATAASVYHFLRGR